MHVAELESETRSLNIKPSICAITPRADSQGCVNRKVHTGHWTDQPGSSYGTTLAAQSFYLHKHIRREHVAINTSPDFRFWS